MQAEELALPGVFLLTPKRFGDDRGFFSETFNQQLFDEIARTLDDFAGGDLIDQRIVEQSYGRSHAVRLSKAVSLGNERASILLPPLTLGEALCYREFGG